MTVFAAAGCFVLSFVTGLFAQVGFGWLLLRALLMGVLGGAMAIGLRWLVLRFLPELSQGVGGLGPEPSVETGRNLDIVVADDAVEGAAEGIAEDAPEGGAKLEAVAVDPDDGEQGDFAEELEELKASPILTAKGEAPDETYKPVKPPDVIEDVDVLPDLESFSDSFAVQDVAGEGGAEAPPEGRSANSGSSSKSSALNDSETIAQAIRTTLHRDKKG